MAEVRIRKATLLAAGRGTRMGHITEQVPKPMLEVAGKALLEHILERLTEAGTDEFLIVVGYRHELIESYFRGSPRHITFKLQDHVNGTGSAALLAREFVGNDLFLLSYGDILVDPANYRRLVDVRDDTEAIVSVRRNEDVSKGGAVFVNDLEFWCGSKLLYSHGEGLDDQCARGREIDMRTLPGHEVARSPGPASPRTHAKDGEGYRPRHLQWKDDALHLHGKGRAWRRVVGPPHVDEARPLAPEADERVQALYVDVVLDQDERAWADLGP